VTSQPSPPYGQRPQPGTTLPAPVAFEPVAGTPFGVAIVGVPSRASGPATASLVTGIASLVVSFVVICFATLGVDQGWGPLVAGAFAVLAGFLGGASLLLGRYGLRQIRASAGWSTVTGRGLALAGMICAACGLVFTVVSVLISLALVSSQP
jgi:hypothetical protein